MPNKVWINNTLSYLFCLKIDDKQKHTNFIQAFAKLCVN